MPMKREFKRMIKKRLISAHQKQQLRQWNLNYLEIMEFQVDVLLASSLEVVFKALLSQIWQLRR